MRVIQSKYFLSKPKWRAGRTCQYSFYRTLFRKNQMPMLLMQHIKWQKQLLFHSNKKSLILKHHAQVNFITKQWLLTHAQQDWIKNLSYENVNDLMIIDELIKMIFSNPDNRKNYMQLKNNNSPFLGKSPMTYLSLSYDCELDSKIKSILRNLTSIAHY